MNRLILKEVANCSFINACNLCEQIYLKALGRISCILHTEALYERIDTVFQSRLAGLLALKAKTSEYCGRRECCEDNRDLHGEN